MVYQFSDKQKVLLKELGFDPDRDYNDEESEKLLDAVADHLMDTGFGEDYKANEAGNLCEDIISILTEA